MVKFLLSIWGLEGGGNERVHALMYELDSTRQKFDI